MLHPQGQELEQCSHSSETGRELFSDSTTQTVHQGTVAHAPGLEELLVPRGQGQANCCLLTSVIQGTPLSDPAH
jgi:hypothetical protein